MKDNTEQDAGFTLIELLVVLIITGILAGVAIPALLSQKRKSFETTAKSDLRTIAFEVSSFYQDSTGALVLAAAAAPRTWQLTSGTDVVAEGPLSEGNAVSTAGSITSAESYCVAVVPSYEGARPWKATQDGLAAGDC